MAMGICFRCFQFLQGVRYQQVRRLTAKELFTVSQRRQEPTPDWSYLLDSNNHQAIKESILNRKGVGDIKEVVGFVFRTPLGPLLLPVR